MARVPLTLIQCASSGGPKNVERSDREAWSEAKRAELDRAQAAMRRVPQVAEALAAIGGDTPHVVIECHKGHPVIEVQLAEDYHGNLFVTEVSEPLRARREVVARGASPFDTEARQRSSVCAEPGCPVILMDGMDTCEAHGSRVSNRVDGNRVQLVCKACTERSGTGKVRPIVVTQRTLLERYTVALATGIGYMRLN